METEQIMQDVKAGIGRALTPSPMKRGEKAGAPDAIEILTSQHREVDALFEELEKAGDRAHKTKQKLAQKIAEKLTAHARLEEKHFYPAAKEADEALVAEAAEEHFGVKNMLQRLAKAKPGSEEFDARVTVLKELVEHHVKEEEQDLFPKCREALGAEKLTAMGIAIAQAMAKNERAAVTPRKH